MTGGSHIHPDKYLGMARADRPPIPSGPSAVFPGCYKLGGGAEGCKETEGPSWLGAGGGWRRCCVFFPCEDSVEPVRYVTDGSGG